MFIKYLLLFVTAFSIISCAHSPSLGEKMVAHAESTKLLGQQWMDGKQAVADAHADHKAGKKMIKQGHQNIKAGEQLIAEGEKQLIEGQYLVNRAEQTKHEGLTQQAASEVQFKESLQHK